MTMTREEYYTAPEQEIFDEVKQVAINIWNTYDDTHGYASKKIDRIKDIQNVQDNTAYIIAMFDQVNRAKLRDLLSEKAAVWFNDLIEFGGKE